jgi:betaine-homocysteine S-methyltransferase
MPAVKGLRQRLDDGEFVINAEGYLFEFERRGYLQAGPFVPEVVLEHPHLVKQMYEEFVHAGSDVVEAFTYYGHREKLRVIGREADLEPLNRNALRMAREVADEHGLLMAGNINNSTRYDPNNPKSHIEVEEMFKESITWAVEEGADFIIAETFPDFGEAKLALECIRKYAPGREAVIMFSQHDLKLPGTRDGVKFTDACKQLEDMGADVVGLNCSCGPRVLMDIMKEVRKVCKGHLAALPVPYRTTWDCPQMQNLIMPKTGKRAFPYNLDAYLSPIDDIIEFGKECIEYDIKFTGLCCGNTGKYTRNLAETLGRKPPASRYSPNMDLHYIFGTDKSKLHSCNVDTLKTLLDDQGAVKPQDHHVMIKNKTTTA